MSLTLTPLVFKGLKVANGSASPEPGAGIIAFTVLVIWFLGGGIGNLIVKYRRAVGREKTQLSYVLIGLAGTFTLIFITNFVLVVAFSNSALIPLGPTYTLVFTGLLAYAIVRHQLFDIRAAAARGLAYLLSLGTIGLIFGVIIFAISGVFRGAAELNTGSRAFFIALALLAGLIYPRVKYFFDRFTRRIFFRDAYDIQDIIDKLSGIAASEIDLYKVLNSSRNVLTSALKSSFIEFVLYKNGKPYIEAHTHRTIDPVILELSSNIGRQHKELLAVEELTYENLLREKFAEAGVALSLMLRTQEQVVGYVLLGEKRSGDVYNSQDKKLLLILANELAIAVQNALRFEEIQNFNLTLQAKVDEATRKLRHANEKLKSLDETKDDFISMASHQLRTPLTSIKGYLSMVIEGDTGKISPLQEKMLGQAFLSSQRMVYLIADLLNVSRLKTGKFIIEAAPTNLATIIEEELAQLTETAASRGLTLTYDKPKDFPTLMLDETKTRQVIMNFADNAIYYTPSGGHINVKLTETPTTVEFRVIDDGIGVPRSEQHHLFNKFYRAGNARQARPDGTGLGLFMAKKVIIGQGGALIFESKQGKGSTFGFIFSKSQLAVKPSETSPPETVATTPKSPPKAKKKPATKKAK